MAAYDFPDTAGKPTDGSFEYTAPDGTLYEWNGYAWVVPTNESGGGSGGGAARVLTQVLPPSPAEDGDMYWCTDDGRLYLYYDDADTKQWVDASPDGGGSSPATYWDRNGTTLSPSTSGDSLTVDGTATFGEGTVELAENTGLKITDGRCDIYLATASTSSQALVIKSDVGGTENEVAAITADGAAMFAGFLSTGTDVAVAAPSTNGFTSTDGGQIFASRNIGGGVSPCINVFPGDGTSQTAIINNDGSSMFGGQVTGKYFTSDMGGSGVPGNFTSFVAKDLNNTQNVKIYADGHAIFNGAVTAPNVTFNLEPDNSANYVSTMVDGEETQVYNGPTLNVKELLLTLQTAAARIATLEAKVQTLESDHTTLMNNNNGGGY